MDSETELRRELEIIRESTRELLDALSVPNGRCVRKAWDRACLLNGRFGAIIQRAAFQAYEDLWDGSLPWNLKGADWRLYASIPHPLNWDGFCAAWWGITWVRCQAICRCADAEAEAEDWNE